MVPRVSTAILLTLCLSASSAEGETCTPFEGRAALADVEAADRLAFLGRAFDRETRDVELWSILWGSTYGTAAAVQASILPFAHDYGLRVDLTAGAISAAFGSVLLFGLPLRVTLPLTSVRRRFDDPKRCRVLADAESALVSAAALQALSSGWAPHIGNVVVNAVLGLILGVGYGRWESAAISVSAGIAVGEANVLTQPHHLPAALAQYRMGRLGTGTPSLAVGHRVWRIAPTAMLGGVGVALSLEL